MLGRQKCEALANYYLGFNGWSGKVQYHRQEEVEESKVMSDLNGVNQELFWKGEGGVDCKAGLPSGRIILWRCWNGWGWSALHRAASQSNGGKQCDYTINLWSCLLQLMAEVGKKARGEAVIAAWSRVVLVIVLNIQHVNVCLVNHQLSNFPLTWVEQTKFWFTVIRSNYSESSAWSHS